MAMTNRFIFRSDEELTPALETFYDRKFTSINLADKKPNYLLIPLSDAAPQFYLETYRLERFTGLFSVDQWYLGRCLVLISLL